MIKKLIIATITTSLLLAGCGERNITPIITAQQNKQEALETTATSDTIDNSQYVKKVWVVKNRTTDDNFSFYIYKIAEGKIEGKFSIGGIAEPDQDFYSPNYLGNLSGTIHYNTAECQFSDKDGYNGNVKLVFSKGDEIEATIKYTSKSQYNKDKSFDGTFQFRPYNLKDEEGYEPFEKQCFTVELNSWGKVNFVSGKIIGGKHIPTVAFLTNKDGDIFYNFTSGIPNNVDFNAVSIKDMNKDGLKDIIIIYGTEDEPPFAAKIFFQKADGTFPDVEYQELDDSVTNKDIKSIIAYLLKF